ncbi:hypothetical protein MGN70_011350 [Eutypa lata]|nr:hypothetical protein MGN70_011350 [Eutypa lata]
MRPAALALALGTLAPGSLGGIIPYTSTGCTGWQLDECAVEQAKDRFIEWGQHNKVGAGKVMWYDDDNHSVSWWICNCKKYWGDHVVPEELDDVLDILYEKCGGEYRSGWVYAEDWDKGWTVERRVARDGKHRWELCPDACLLVPDVDEDVERVE